MSRLSYTVNNNGGSLEVSMDLGILDRIPHVVGSDYIRQYAHEKIAEYAEPFVPMKSGALVASVDATADALIYAVPYANRQYRGVTDDGVPYNYSTDKHPLAGSHFIERGLSGRTDELANELHDEILRAAKRRAYE